MLPYRKSNMFVKHSLYYYSEYKLIIVQRKEKFNLFKGDFI